MLAAMCIGLSLVCCSILPAQVSFSADEYDCGYYNFITYTIDCRSVQDASCTIDVYVLSDSCLVIANGQPHLFSFYKGEYETAERIIIEGSDEQDLINVHGDHMQVDVYIYAYEGDDVIEIFDAISVDANSGPGDDRYYGSFYVGPEWSDNVWGGRGMTFLKVVLVTII